MDSILVGKAITTADGGQVHLLAKYGNRHGLVAGATGTGKTVTLMTLAEGFSRLGVPVFMADVKGDIAGLAAAGAPSEKLAARVQQIGIDGYTNEASPVVFWDLYGKLGHPVRTTVSEMGPMLLSRILELNDTQAGVLDILFKLADDRGLLLLDLDDLRALLGLVAAERKDISTSYGLVSTQSVGAIQRGLLTLEEQGGDVFFGEPMLDINDLMQTDDGKGIVNILAADKLMSSPRLYSTFLLWLLSELFEQLPEVGDMDEPKLVFFFDEAHLLFNEAPPALLEKIEQVVRLIRSKGVGVYEKALDRESAYEKLRGAPAAAQPANGGTSSVPSAQPQTQASAPEDAPASGGGWLGGLGDLLGGTTGPRGGRREGLGEALAKSAARAIGSQVGREIIRGVLGSMLGGSSARRR